LTYQYDPFRPGYRGPDDATQTPTDIMASPASVGTALTDAIGSTYFGERDLIKLAYDDASSSAQEGDLIRVSAPASTGATIARDMGPLSGLAVPNLDPSHPGQYAVHAGDVVGSINLNSATGLSENDVYRVVGQPGDLLTAEVYSVSLRGRVTDPIDSIVRVYNSAGQLLSWYGQPAVNDDGFDNSDSLIQDLVIPADGKPGPGTFSSAGPGPTSSSAVPATTHSSATRTRTRSSARRRTIKSRQRTTRRRLRQSF
jgi:hypothetical protein